MALSRSMHLRFCLDAMLVIASLVLTSAGCQAFDEAESKALIASIDAIITESYPDADAPGCAVLVRLDGETLFARGYGRASLESDDRNTSTTNFRLASVTKQFTAAAILRLADQGKLTLDESLRDVFPDFPEYGAAITIRQVLGHTSGLADYENLLPKDIAEPILDAGVLDVMKAQTATTFPPGSKYSYSNSGYAVLAMIVEKRSGQSFATFLHDEFFEPLGMDGTVAFEKGKPTVANRAYGYKRNEDGTWKSADQSMTSSVLGDGGVYTSISDYAKWADAWFAGQVLTPESQQLAWTDGRLPDGAGTGYGFGWYISDSAGEKVVAHTGGTTGFNNYVRLIPSRRLCVGFLANREGSEPKTLAPKIERLVMDAMK